MEEVFNRVDDRKGRMLFVAYNRHIAAELRQRLPNTVKVKTLNALGFEIYREAFPGAQVDDNKLKNLADRFIQTQDAIYRRPAATLAKVAKTHGLGPDSDSEHWDWVTDHHGLSWDLPEKEVLLLHVRRLLTASLQQRDILDFADQIYMPVAFGIRAAYKPRLCVVDEAQDLSALNHSLLRLLEPERLIAVGDRHQSIYGFRGADTESMDNLAKQFKCEELPLATTFRCDRSIVHRAQEIVPQITAREGAQLGEVGTLEELNWQGAGVGENDLVLCRLNAPLIALAVRLLSKGIGCRVIGLDLKKQLVQMARDRHRTQLFGHDGLMERLRGWAEMKVGRLQEAEKEMEARQLADLVRCLRSIVQQGPVMRTLWDLEEYLKELFDSDGVRLSTVHRAKGLEANRVFVIASDLLPFPYARLDWQQQQEDNLLYVAITRARHELYFLPTENVIIGDHHGA